MAKKNDAGDDVFDQDGTDFELDGKLDDSEITHPPLDTESTGNSELPSPVAGEVTRDQNFQSEKERLDRIGVRHIEDGTRGVNVKPEGHHAPEARLEPTPAEPNADGKGPGEYVLQNGGKIPGTQLHSPVLPTPPAPLPNQPVPPPIGSGVGRNKK